METLDDLFNRILTNGPSPGTLLLVLSKIKEGGNPARVIQECLKALNICPNDIPIRQLLAESYFEAGLLSQAEGELEKVATRMDDLIPIYKLQAEIYRRQRREEEAMDALRLYLAHRPEDEDALHLLDTLKPPEIAPITEPEATIEEVAPTVEEVEEREAESLEEEAPPEIATLTLAEIYFDQGQIQEAIDIYEKVVAQNPENNHSKQRLDELKDMMAAGETIEDKGLDRIRQKKEKMIAILEAWLANIQEKAKTPMTVT